MLFIQAFIINLLHQCPYSIHPAQEKVRMSVITLLILQGFYTKLYGFLVIGDFELLLLYPFISFSS